MPKPMLGLPTGGREAGGWGGCKLLVTGCRLAAGGGCGDRLSPPHEKVFWPDLAGFSRIGVLAVASQTDEMPMKDRLDWVEFIWTRMV